MRQELFSVTMITIARSIFLFLLIFNEVLKVSSFSPQKQSSTSRLKLNEIDVDALIGSNDRSGYDGGITGYTRDLTRKGVFSRFKNRFSEPGRVWIKHNEARRREKELYERAMGGCKSSKIKRVVKTPYRLLKNLAPRPKPGTLLLVRTGQSLGNFDNIFTGWTDVDMTQRGYHEVEHAARLIREAGYDIDVVFTSRMKRAICATRTICKDLEEDYLPVFKSWRLNDRHFGDFTGKSKEYLEMEYGEEMIRSTYKNKYSIAYIIYDVKVFRFILIYFLCFVEGFEESLVTKPPSLSPDDLRWPGRDRKYADIALDQIPTSETVMDTVNRIRPMWDEKILAELEEGHNVMIVAHENTLRCLMRIIDGKNCFAYFVLISYF